MADTTEQLPARSAQQADHGSTNTKDAPAANDFDAAIVLVGDELLSGSIVDCNGPMVAKALHGVGILLKELRIIGDDPADVATVVRALRLRHTWVFVIGGLGPTHDDCTARGIADAFGSRLTPHQDALRLLEEHHAPAPVPPGRLPAINLPAGCRVIPDLISGAAGFRIGNVIALPGVPQITAALLPTALSHLPSGLAFTEATIKAPLMEPDIAAEMRQIQTRHPSVKIGCYPYFGNTDAGVKLVLRSRDEAALTLCERELRMTLVRLTTKRYPASEPITSALCNEECLPEWLPTA